jgi:hypothetical protein
MAVSWKKAEPLVRVYADRVLEADVEAAWARVDPVAARQMAYVPSIEGYPSMGAQRWDVAPDTLVVEVPVEARLVIELTPAGCVAVPAAFRFRGDREVAHLCAAHGTVRRAMVCSDPHELGELIPGWTFAREAPADPPVTMRRRSFAAIAGDLRRALFRPPYPVRLPRGRKKRTLFEEWLRALLGEALDPKTLEVRSWATRGYGAWFDGGREWWGEYWWTFHRPGTDVIVGITASATD